MIAVADIQKIVGTYYGIPRAVLLGPRQFWAVARPRQVSMVLCREFTKASLPRIGRQHGRRDHTTVIHAMRRLPGLMAESPKLSRDVAEIRRIIGLVQCERDAYVACESAWAEFERL